MPRYSTQTAPRLHTQRSTSGQTLRSKASRQSRAPTLIPSQRRSSTRTSRQRRQRERGPAHRPSRRHWDTTRHSVMSSGWTSATSMKRRVTRTSPLTPRSQSCRFSARATIHLRMSLQALQQSGAQRRRTYSTRAPTCVAACLRKLQRAAEPRCPRKSATFGARSCRYTSAKHVRRSAHTKRKTGATKRHAATRWMQRACGPPTRARGHCTCRAARGSRVAG